MDHSSSNEAIRFVLSSGSSAAAGEFSPFAPIGAQLARTWPGIGAAILPGKGARAARGLRTADPVAQMRFEPSASPERFLTRFSCESARAKLVAMTKVALAEAGRRQKRGPRAISRALSAYARDLRELAPELPVRLRGLDALVADSARAMRNVTKTQAAKDILAALCHSISGRFQPLM